MEQIRLLVHSFFRVRPSDLKSCEHLRTLGQQHRQKSIQFKCAERKSGIVSKLGRAIRLNTNYIISFAIGPWYGGRKKIEFGRTDRLLVRWPTIKSGTNELSAERGPAWTHSNVCSIVQTVRPNAVVSLAHAAVHVCHGRLMYAGRPTQSNQLTMAKRRHLLAMRMEWCIRETFALVLAKEATVAQSNVVNFIARTLAVELVPFLVGSLSFPVWLDGWDGQPWSVHIQLVQVATYWPREVCSSSVTSVDVPGHRQLLARRAYLNSSSHTTCSGRATTVITQFSPSQTKHFNLPANATWILFSGRNIWMYCGTFGAKSRTAQLRRMVCWSWAKNGRNIRIIPHSFLLPSLLQHICRNN